MASATNGESENPQLQLQVWDRGQGYPRDEHGKPKEGRNAHVKFKEYLALGPKRTKAALARLLGAANSSVHQLATKYCWDERAKAWDAAHGLAFASKTENQEIELPIPERLQEVASQPVTASADPENPKPAMAPLALNPVDDRIRAKEQEHERMLEEFRSEAEALGRRQMQIARGMTSIVGNSVAQMLKSQETLSARAIPGFISAACTLAAAAHHTWGRSIGVDRLLLQMEQAVSELERRTIEDAEVIG